jgi:hypothetical protein
VKEKSPETNHSADSQLMTAEVGKKYRQFMFVQQLRYLGYDLTALNERIDIIKPLEFAYVVHDKDLTEDGELIEPHLHLALRFENPVSLKRLAESLETEPQYIAQWKGAANNLYSYLIHRTETASDRYQYEVNEVVANFDFPGKIERIEQAIQGRKGKRDGTLLNETLDALLEGNITLFDAFEILPGRIAGKHRKKLESAYQTRMELNAKVWLENKKALGKPIQVFWFYGPAGVGKTRYAKQYLSRIDDGEIFISGSNRDPFQNYSKSFAHKVILDDIRPNGTFSYEELLRIFDPWNMEVSVGSRYSDKNLQVDIFIITSPLAPDVFVDTLQVFELDDNFDQLLRRLTTVMYFDDQYIYPAVPYLGMGKEIHYKLDEDNKVINQWSGHQGEQEHGLQLVREAGRKTIEKFLEMMSQEQDKLTDGKGIRKERTDERDD